MAKKWNALDRFIARIRYNKICRNLPKDLKNATVCDIGCGVEGNFLAHLSDKIHYGYGFDRKTGDSAFKNIELKQVDDIQRGIPLPDESCDYVFLIAVLEHLSDVPAMLNEISRILKKGGALILTTPTPLGKPVLEFMAFKLHIISEEEILDHKHYFDGDEINQVCKAAGLDVKGGYRRFMFGMNSFAKAVKK